MKLYLVQHGKAVDKAVDPERPLAEEGVADVEAVGGFLASRQLGVAEVWHSGKARARQTAERLAAHVAPDGDVVERPGLAPNDPVAPVRDAAAAREDDLMIVGHLPFMAKLAGLLLAGDVNAAPVAFEMGGVVCLEGDADQAWAVRWMVTPALLVI